jgi:hypothetical protein
VSHVIQRRPPLLGDISCRAAAAGWIEHQIAGVGGHEDATGDNSRIRLHDIPLLTSVKSPPKVNPVVGVEPTKAKLVRQPVFLGIREDKNAKEVVRERAM